MGIRCETLGVCSVWICVMFEVDSYWDDGC